MIDASTALQTLIRSRLSTDPGVTALVPADDIRDSNGLPVQIPAVLIGGGQVTYDELKLTAHADLHIWVEEVGTTGAKAIAGAIRNALRSGPWPIADHHCSVVRVTSDRFMRDPNNQYSHGVVSIEAHMVERHP
ncbi:MULTISPECIES: DUF3168 domain-containing protein [unclassified Beijerinckia]|uniref:DUF3168 domain-containing protein n=1 Tax=unclassified Beijerinckia TaxID=2638183 RepID=UPI00089597CC|nr:MULTISPECIES: DUF3168 domain-containing protein [unclassified Beijerinckia]MDH7795799.1 hypothetical protein [Beijerinckia sp. GAS462]SEC16887.1 Protein of unknown function [Beijerinckia sp. 28-YEA-48]